MTQSMSDCTVATEMMEDLEVTDSEPARLALNAGNALLKALTGRVGLLVMDSMTGYYVRVCSGRKAEASSQR